MMLGQCPNITGALKLVHNADTYSSYKLSAAGACFSLGFTDKKYHIVLRTDAIDIGVNDIQFNASKSNAVYSSNNIQMPSFQIFIIIKAWSAGGWTVPIASEYMEELFFKFNLIDVPGSFGKVLQKYLFNPAEFGMFWYINAPDDDIPISVSRRGAFVWPVMLG